MSAVTEQAFATTIDAAETLEVKIGATLVYADWCEESGQTTKAEQLRTRPIQMTREGDRIVTVARDGADQAPCGNGWSVPIWTTTVYVARRRQSDGVLTWRRQAAIRSHRTAGRDESGAMIQRAREHAEEMGVEYRLGVRHGMVCR